MPYRTEPGPPEAKTVPYGMLEPREGRRTKKAVGAVPTAIIYVVGLTGFEPATSRSRTERSTKLSHNP